MVSSMLRAFMLVSSMSGASEIISSTPRPPEGVVNGKTASDAHAIHDEPGVHHEPEVRQDVFHDEPSCMTGPKHITTAASGHA